MSQAARASRTSAEVAEGVYRLGTRYINFYLLAEGGRLTLIDTGLSGYWRQLAQALGQLGRRVDAIDAVLVTHQHADHIGLAERVRRQAGAPVYAHPADADVVRGRAPGRSPNFFAHIHRPFVLRYLLHAIGSGAARSTPVAELRTFDDGEVVDVPGRPRVIHTPGHTPGSCALLVDSRDVLFSADALATVDLLTGRSRPALMPTFTNEDQRQAVESLKRLEATAARTVLSGHGEPWHDGVKEAVAIARRAL